MILFAIGLSWVIAVTVTPVLGVMILKAKPGAADKDPYANVFYRGYRSLLAGCVRFRWATLALMVALLALSIYGFRFVPRSFFPDSTTPQFTVDYWVRQGTDITKTAADLAVIERQIRKLEGVTMVATSVGQGFTRFLLTYSPEEPNPAYGQMIVTVDRFERMAELMPRIEAKIMGDFPGSLVIANAYVLGPGGGSDIEARLRGPDHRVLRQLSAKVQAIMREDPEARDVRDDWRDPVMVVRPRLTELAASNAGISRRDISRTLQRTFSGLPVGVFREGEELIPMVARAPAAERLDVDDIRDVQVWSPVAGATVPLRQVVSGFTTEWDDGIIARRNRRPTITAQANAIGNAGELFQRLRPRIEALVLPPGYSLEWGGEYESASEAMAALAGQLPPTLILMVLIVIVLFNALRQPAIIWMTAPLGLIGVTAALLVTGQPFGFMAILGALSLIGMLVSNSIVLIEEIDSQIREGKDRFQAILEGSVSRLRPVGIMALTTVLGMIPLLQDVFFASMAVTIMGGLAFATVLTLLVVPVLYAVMFRIPSPRARGPDGAGGTRRSSPRGGCEVAIPRWSIWLRRRAHGASPWGGLDRLLGSGAFDGTRASRPGSMNAGVGKSRLTEGGPDSSWPGWSGSGGGCPTRRSGAPCAAGRWRSSPAAGRSTPRQCSRRWTSGASEVAVDINPLDLNPLRPLRTTASTSTGSPGRRSSSFIIATNVRTGRDAARCRQRADLGTATCRGAFGDACPPSSRRWRSTANRTGRRLLREPVDQAALIWGLARRRALPARPVRGGHQATPRPPCGSRSGRSSVTLSVGLRDLGRRPPRAREIPAPDSGPRAEPRPLPDVADRLGTRPDRRGSRRRLRPGPPGCRGAHADLGRSRAGPPVVHPAGVHSSVHGGDLPPGGRIDEAVQPRA